jgi:hypothetical protein
MPTLELDGLNVPNQPPAAPAPTAPISPGRAVVWAGTRVIHSVPHGNSVVLDCLVPARTAGGGSPTSMPFTLRVHAVAALTPVHLAASLLQQWAQTDALVDVLIRGEGQRTLLSFESGTSHITMELERLR